MEPTNESICHDPGRYDKKRPRASFIPSSMTQLKPSKFSDKVQAPSNVANHGRWIGQMPDTLRDVPGWCQTDLRNSLACRWPVATTTCNYTSAQCCLVPPHVWVIAKC